MKRLSPVEIEVAIKAARRNSGGKILTALQIYNAICDAQIAKGDSEVIRRKEG